MELASINCVFVSLLNLNINIYKHLYILEENQFMKINMYTEI